MDMTNQKEILVFLFFGRIKGSFDTRKSLWGVKGNCQFSFDLEMLECMRDFALQFMFKLIMLLKYLSASSI